ncbi:MAG: DEAD/DEAH box helicase, partial [Thermosphaera sp.]
VKRIFKRLANFYGLEDDEEIVDIIEKVIQYHDAGKLHPEWRIGSEVTHSDKSVEYYCRKKGDKDLSEIDYLIAFLILRHHGALTPRIGFDDKCIKSIGDSFGTYSHNTLRFWFFNRFSFEKRVKLADSYGLFKIADCLSASGSTSFTPQKPIVGASDIESLLNDSRRRRTQEAIANLGRLGFLRAPTGWGKTIASPLYLLNKSVNKVFFIFPTVTAINKLYDRFENIFGDKIDKYFYFYDVEVYGKGYESIDTGRKIFWSRYFLKPYMITSVDQFLLSFLHVGNYHMKRVMFRNSAIIFDEIHLLNSRMLYLLLHFLSTFWKEYGFSVLFMSATLTNGLKGAIEEFMREKVQELRDIIFDGKDFVDLLEEYRKLSRVKIET